MIIARLMGGLGNQLFQYAIGRSLAIRHGVELKLDLASFAQDRKREYQLGAFNIAAEIATACEIGALVPDKRSRLRYECNKLSEALRPWHRRRHLSERTLEFDADAMRAGSRVYLDGYWQSPRYFESISTSLRAELVLREPVDPGAGFEGESVCLHIRRGDYAADARARQVHGLCPLSYYEAAVDCILVVASDPRILVFSDDPDWARANVHLPVETVFMPVGAAYIDLISMSRCRYFIIANSSYSWWAAWLSGVVPERVYAPRAWGIDPALNTVSRFPRGWNVL